MLHIADSGIYCLIFIIKLKPPALHNSVLLLSIAAHPTGMYDFPNITISSNNSDRIVSKHVSSYSIKVLIQKKTITL